MNITYHKNTAGFQIQYFAKEYANRTAVVSYSEYRRRQYTYKELLALSVQTAGLLLKIGCRKGDAIMVCAPNSTAYTAIIFAYALPGLKLVPVDFSTSIETVVRYCPQNSRNGQDDENVVLTGLVTLTEKAREKVDVTQLMAIVNHHLSRHQKLAKLIVWEDDDFPKTPSGKIKRKKVLERCGNLLQTAGSETRMNVDSVGLCPLPSHESRYGQVARLIADQRKIDVNNLSPGSRLISDLGFDSLGLMELINYIEAQLGGEVPQDKLFNQDLSVSEFVTLISTDTGQSSCTTCIHVSLAERVLLALGRCFSRLIMRSLLKIFLDCRHWKYRF